MASHFLWFKLKYRKMKQFVINNHFRSISFDRFLTGYPVLLLTIAFFERHEKPKWLKNSGKNKTEKVISTANFLNICFAAQSLGFSFDDISYAVAVTLERIWTKKHGEENKIKCIFIPISQFAMCHPDCTQVTSDQEIRLFVFDNSVHIFFQLDINLGMDYFWTYSQNWLIQNDFRLRKWDV